MTLDLEEVEQQSSSVNLTLKAFKEHNIFEKIPKSSDDGFESRKVIQLIEKIDKGIEDSQILAELCHYIQQIEAERSILKLELGRIKEENSWLKEEVCETQAKIQSIFYENPCDLNMNDEGYSLPEFEIKPHVPSKIPVGTWRLSKLPSHPEDLQNKITPPSKIPIATWKRKTIFYKSVIDKVNAKKVEKSKGQINYFDLATSSNSAR